MEDEEPTALEYFSGGVPTGESFRGTLAEIDGISAADDQEAGMINRLQELCFIGLFSYFEAFCKDFFAALVNIEPTLIVNLKAAGQDVAIDAEHVALYGEECGRRIGFILVSKYDFGTPKKINALFGALLKITPFNVSEAAQFDRLLLDRHLLVHLSTHRVACVVIRNPLELYIFEAYAAMALDTARWNTFETH
jgi:hypothetical protein